MTGRARARQATPALADLRRRIERTVEYAKEVRDATASAETAYVMDAVIKSLRTPVGEVYE